MSEFNRDFNNDNNEMNGNTDNRTTNMGNNASDNTPVNHAPVSNTPADNAPVSNTPTVNTPADEMRAPVTPDPVQPAEEPMQTGSYSYSGDRLTENRTQVQQNGPSYGNASGGQQYNMPHMNGNGGISYTPDSEKSRKTKKKAKTFTLTRAGAAIFCCAAICLSAATGFLGAYAASSLTGESVQQETTADASSRNPVNSTTVMYRSVATTGLGSSQNGRMTYQEVASLVQDSVVEIVTEFNNTSLWFQYVTSGAGSGVIMSADGYVITNNHVIYDDDAGKVSDSITVRLRNGDEYKAQVIGTDSDSDIAVLKIEAEGLTPAVCGNSSSLTVGEEVLAVGNPLGELGGTVTNGIVSATDREIDVGDVTMNLIQTNAAVNPGNSGGGLFNMSGELIGVVNAKSSGSDVEGLGFAIPINDALRVAEQLLEFGYVRGKVMIGVTFLDATDASIARYYGLNPGLYVSSLTEGYNDKNLKPGDRVIAINGEEVSVYEDITSIVKASSVGDVLKFQLYRDGKLTEVDVTVYEKVPQPEDDVDFEEDEEKKGYTPLPEDETEDVYVSPFPGEGSSGYGGFGNPFSDFFNFPW